MSLRLRGFLPCLRVLEIEGSFGGAEVRGDMSSSKGDFGSSSCDDLAVDAVLKVTEGCRGVWFEDEALR